MTRKLTAIKINIDPFKNSIASLEQSMAAHDADPGNALVRDSCIKRFAYTYELSHKTLKRFLEAASASAETIDHATFPDLIRMGNESGLLSSPWPVWKEYREARNGASHAYDEQCALEILAVIPRFLDDSRDLRDRLARRTYPMTERPAGSINLSPADRALVCDILKRHTPEGTRVWVFGSRAGGKIKKYSDLDLALEGKERLPLSSHAELADAFSESDLPFRVDIVDLKSADASFSKLIDEHKIFLFAHMEARRG